MYSYHEMEGKEGSSRNLREGGGRKEEKGKEEGKTEVYNKYLNGRGCYNFLLALVCTVAVCFTYLLCVPRWKGRGRYCTNT